MLEGYRSLKVKSNMEIATNIFQVEVEKDFNISIKPGQFFMLRAWEAKDPFLARPISIGDVGEKSLTFLYESKGKGTRIFSNLRKGDRLEILGPLGNGFDLASKGRTAIVGGGIGIAPLLYLLKSLEGEVDFYAGFRDEVYWIERIEKYAKNVYISTEDGSRGHKGYIVDVFDAKKYARIITCGPLPMMEKLMEVCEDKSKVEMSMEKRMACGIGACLGCTIETVDGIKRVCKDGPIFMGTEVIFDE